MSQVFVEQELANESKGGVWNSIFFVLAGLVSLVVMEIIKGDLRRFLFLAFSTTLFFVILAFGLFRKQKISFFTYVNTFAVTALFLAFIFLIPFWVNPIVRQAGIIFSSILMVSVPYLAEVFVIESLSFGLLAFTLFRFRVILDTSIFVLLAIYLLIIWGFVTLGYFKFPEAKEKIKIGLPPVFIILVELFLIFLMIPINLSSRGILLGVTFYFMFELVSLKNKQALTRRLAVRDCLLLGATYLFILASAHWV